MSDEAHPHSFPSSPEFPDASYEGMGYAVLRRYVLGESDPAERRRVAEWAAQVSSRRAYLEALARSWQRVEMSTSAAEREDTDTAWVALGSRIEVPPADDLPYVASWEAPAVEVDLRHRRPARILTNVFERPRRWSAMKIAAAALLIVGGGAIAMPLVRGSWESSAVAGAPREVTTGVGQRAEVKLGDGSVVVLASKSRVRIPPDFGVRHRELHLEGQAHFTVEHGGRHPFTVRAGGSKTVDIGTAFVVRSYPEDRGVRVVVTDGSVAFGRDTLDVAFGGVSTVLTRGWLGELDGTRAVTAAPVDPTRYLGWMDDRLIFEDTPIAEVAAELERWYDVDVRLADPTLATETLTAEFRAESLSDALSTLTHVLRLRVERVGRTITLARQSV